MKFKFSKLSFVTKPNQNLGKLTLEDELMSYDYFMHIAHSKPTLDSKFGANDTTKVEKIWTQDVQHN